MLRINIPALQALQSAQIDTFLDRMEAWARIHWPEQQPVRNFVRRTFDEAWCFGLRSEECIARYFTWRGDLGDLLFEHPGMEGARELLADDTRSERDKVDSIDVALFGQSFLGQEGD